MKEFSAISAEQQFFGYITHTILVMKWLIGIVIVFLLYTLLRPAGSCSPRSAKELLAQTHMKSLEMAIKGYQTEYHHLPTSPSTSPTTDSPHYNTADTEGKAIIGILTAKDTRNNPRGIDFYEAPVAKKGKAGYTEAGGLVDAWGFNGYIVIMDYDGDGLIADPEHPGSNISASAIIYCAGRDGDYTTWGDNIASWEHFPQSRF